MKPKKKQLANRAATLPQNVKTRGSLHTKKQALKPAPKLLRTTFRTSREMDFFSPKELVTQTGHPVAEWPQVIVKELVDNALDACEEADIAPIIDVTADAGGITVKDNGPGLPEATLKGAMDFTIRASNHEGYVAPGRGAQGNALKTILPMPQLLDPKQGKLIVAAHGKRHVITCGADPISQQAMIHDDVTDQPTVGTEIRIDWTPRKNDRGEAVWPVIDYRFTRG
jgi:DNA topoisomerase VI subunit B